MTISPTLNTRCGWYLVRHFHCVNKPQAKVLGLERREGGLKQTQHTGFGCANDGLPIKPLHTQRAFVRLKGEQIGYCMDRSSVRSLHFPFTLPGCSLFVSPSLSVCQTLTLSPVLNLTPSLPSSKLCILQRIRENSLYLFRYNFMIKQRIMYNIFQWNIFCIHFMNILYALVYKIIMIFFCIL